MYYPRSIRPRNANEASHLFQRVATIEVLRTVKARLKADALRQREARKMWAKAKGLA